MFKNVITTMGVVVGFMGLLAFVGKVETDEVACHVLTYDTDTVFVEFDESGDVYAFQGDGFYEGEAITVLFNTESKAITGIVTPVE